MTGTDLGDYVVVLGIVACEFRSNIIKVLAFRVTRNHVHGLGGRGRSASLQLFHVSFFLEQRSIVVVAVAGTESGDETSAVDGHDSVLDLAAEVVAAVEGIDDTGGTVIVAVDDDVGSAVDVAGHTTAIDGFEVMEECLMKGDASVLAVAIVTTTVGALHLTGSVAADELGHGSAGNVTDALDTAGAGGTDTNVVDVATAATEELAVDKGAALDEQTCVAAVTGETTGIDVAEGMTRFEDDLGFGAERTGTDAFGNLVVVFVDGTVIIIYIVAVAATIDFLDGAAYYIDARRVGDDTADVVAAEDASIAVVATFDEDKATFALIAVDIGGVDDSHVGLVATSEDGAADNDVGLQTVRPIDIGFVVEIVIRQAHVAAYVAEGLVYRSVVIVRLHCALAKHVAPVAAAIDGVDLSVEEYDFGNHRKGTLVVATKDGADIVVTFVSTIIFEVEEDGDGLVDGDAVAATEYTANVAADGKWGARFAGKVVGQMGGVASIDIDVDEGGRLLRLLHLAHIVLANLDSMDTVVVGTVAAAIDRSDKGLADDAQVGRSVLLGEHRVVIGSISCTDIAVVDSRADDSSLVVAAIEGTLDGTSTDLNVGGTVDHSHIAAAIDVTHRRGVLGHAERGKTSGDRIGRCNSIVTVVAVPVVLVEAHIGEVSSGIEVTIDGGRAEHTDVGLVVGRDGSADIVLFRVVVVDASDIFVAVVAMVVAVAAGEDIAIDRAAEDLDVGTYLRIEGVECFAAATRVFASYVAADVAAAVDGSDMAVFDNDPGTPLDIALLASTIEVVDHHLVAAHMDAGAVVDLVSIGNASCYCIGIVVDIVTKLGHI